MNTNTQSTIILVGFMGTGKTTVGHLVADGLGWSFTDTDSVIVARTGRSVASIFEIDGEPAFRALEAAVCTEVHTWSQTVVATGGGILLNPLNRAALLQAGLVVCLQASIGTLLERLDADTPRPLLAGPDRAARLEHVLNERRAIYESIPHQIDTTGLSPQAVAEKVIALWHSIA
jgi:shikimate kinase